MSSTSTEASPAKALGEWPILRHDRTRIVLVYGSLVVIALAVAYWSLFGRFVDYDDEGTLLVTLKAFVGGDALYRDIYTPYGPFYYEAWGGLFALTGSAVSTDAARFVVMGVWAGTSALFGISAQRITGSLALGAGAMATAFAVLNVLTNEPMHPVGLIVLLLASLATALTFHGDRYPLVPGIVIGGLLAALTLTKINVGLFAIAGCVVAAAFTLPALRGRAWVRWPIATVYVLLALPLMAGDFDQESVRDTAFLVVTCALALVISSSSLGSVTDLSDRALTRRVLAIAAGLAGGLVLMVVIILAAGAPFGDMWEDVVVQALRQHDIFTVPLVLPSAAAEWGIAAVAAAAIAARVRSDRPAATPWPGAARLAAGLAIWMSAAHLAPFGLTPSVPVIVVPLILAWVATMAPPGIDERLSMRFARIALPAVAVAETLQVYPVAGTQVSAAAVTFVPVGAVCLHDGARSLAIWSEGQGSLAAARTATTWGTGIVALALALTYTGLARPGFSAAKAYHDQQALPFAGATRLRLGSDQRALYTQLVSFLRDQRCTALVGLPSTNSLYLWSFIDAPAPTLPSAWMTQLDDGLQQRVVDEVRASSRPCAIRNDNQLMRWMNGRPTPDTPLVRYIQSDFKPAATIGGYVALLPRR